MLKTELCTPETGSAIEHAFECWAGEQHDTGHLIYGFDTFFEHGQWWVRCSACDTTWSVVDAEGKGSVNGFSFELTEEGDPGCVDDGVLGPEDLLGDHNEPEGWP